MDSKEFIISFFAALKKNGVSKIDKYDLEIFANSSLKTDDFKKRFSNVEVNNLLGEDLEFLSRIRLIRMIKIFSKELITINMDEKVCDELLSNFSYEDLRNVLMYVVLFKVELSRMNRAKVSYDERYGKVSEELIEKNYKKQLEYLTSFKRDNV